MTPGAGHRVRLLGGDDWALWRGVRLRSLLESPQAFGSTYEREEAFTEPDWRARLDDPDGVAVVATGGQDHEAGRQDDPVGIAGGFPDEPGMLHVVAMWVAPSARGEGVAHLLLDALQAWSATRGRALHLDVAVDNPGARRCYERYGFVATGATHPLRDGSPELTARMVLSGRRGCR